MMYRSGWGTKPGQEITLAIWLRRAAFDAILAAAIPAQFDPALYRERDAWQRAVAVSDVRRQWDPDHDPAGMPLARYATDWLVDIQDISAFVAEQRAIAETKDYRGLLTPREEPYPDGSVVAPTPGY